MEQNLFESSKHSNTKLHCFKRALLYHCIPGLHNSSIWEKEVCRSGNCPLNGLYLEYSRYHTIQFSALPFIQPLINDIVKTDHPDMLCLHCEMKVVKSSPLPEHTFAEPRWGHLQTATAERRLRLWKALPLKGDFDPGEGRRKQIVDQVKLLIRETVQFSDEPMQMNLSNYLHERLRYSYTYLANIFVALEGYNIEKFYIGCRIEKVKELLHCSALSVTEIAYRMHYSSVAHLSAQFRRTTGSTPSQYKRQYLKDLSRFSNKDGTIPEP